MWCWIAPCVELPLLHPALTVRLPPPFATALAGFADKHAAHAAHEAYARYSRALQDNPASISAWCNRSLAALRLGDAARSLADADAALELLREQRHNGPAFEVVEDESAFLSPSQEPQSLQVLRVRAFRRRAEALSAQGRLLDALRTYRTALAECTGSEPLAAALRLAAEGLPPRWLARYWAQVVGAAEAPAPLSSRDGRLLRLVPVESRLEPNALLSALGAALNGECDLCEEARDLLCAAWAAARTPGRSEAAFFRGLAYLEAGNHQQATRDAQVALVYGPRRGPGSPATDAGGGSAWPAALMLQSAALEAAADNVPAALAVARACELAPGLPRAAAAIADGVFTV